MVAVILKLKGVKSGSRKSRQYITKLKAELSFVEPLISRLELEEANDKLA